MALANGANQEPHNVNYNDYVGEPNTPNLVNALRALYTYDNDTFHLALVDDDTLVDKIDISGYTLLQNAVLANNMDAIHILMLENAEVDFSNDFGDTALHVAARTNNAAAIHELFTYSADPEIENNGGLRPIDVAAFKGYAKITPLFPRLSPPNDIKLVVAAKNQEYEQYIPNDVFDEISIDYESQANNALLNPNMCIGIDKIFMNRSYHEAQYIVTAVSGDETLGAASLVVNFDNDYIEIELFCSDYKYKGIGSLMMTAIKKLRTEWGRLIKLKSVPNAHNFYIKQGFTNNAVPHTANGLIKMTYS